jgi:hypothetical protein
MVRFLAILLAAAPLSAAAESPATATAAATPEAAPPTSSPPVSPAASLAAPVPPTAEVPAAAPRSGVTLEVGGWLVLGVAAGLGGLDAAELPRAAARPVSPTPPGVERSFGLSARQSRLRAALGLPTDGLLANTRLQGLVEVDFAGGAAGGDPAQPLLRLRQGWVSAAWERAHLTLLAGQAPGLLGGPSAPESLGHLAVSRFDGAGFLEERAPQVRVSAALGSAPALELQAAVLAPQERNTVPFPGKSTPTGAGVRSGLPDVEGRAALAWGRGQARRLELGVSGHAGRQTYWLDGLPTQPNGSVDSWGGALDVRLDLARLTLLGAAFAGRNLGVGNTIGSGVTRFTDASTGRLVSVVGVRTVGGWCQARLAATSTLVLLLGGGFEAPHRSDLPGSSPDNLVVWRNVQVSGGALLDLTSRWRAGLELTGFSTRSTAATDSRARSAQVELTTLYAF